MTTRKGKVRFHQQTKRIMKHTTKKQSHVVESTPISLRINHGRFDISMMKIDIKRGETTIEFQIVETHFDFERQRGRCSESY